MPREDAAKLNRERVKRCMSNRDKLTVILPKGTMDRIRSHGYSGNAFAKELILKELDRLDQNP
jgi:hypothetical protein